MNRRGDQRGLILSGIALLLVLPAVLLVTSYFSITIMGGEAASLQSLSDKVTYAGHDIERMVHYMKNYKIPLDGPTLGALADNYRAATGLLVEISLEGGPGQKVSIMVRDPRGTAQYFSVVTP